MIDNALDLQEEPPNLESSFPSHLSDFANAQPWFWTIKDDDFEPDIPLHSNLLPKTNPPAYDEHSEAAAWDTGTEDSVIAPEEKDYLEFLEDLKYSEYFIHH